VSRAGESVKLKGHLSFRVRRTPATCMICRELKDASEPTCERCGLGAFHLDCYIDAIVSGRRERRFWATRSADVAEALSNSAIFLCPGCRS
jgi:hypothetical protein